MADDSAAPAAAPAASSSRGLTGYMLFLQRNREQIKQELGTNAVKDVTKLAAERWRALSDEEKQKWNVEGKLVVTAPKPASSASSSSSSCSIPTSKVREICKLDREVKTVNGEALHVLAQATELFLGQLIAVSLEQSASKRQIKLVDVHHAVHWDDARFGFLVMDFDAPAQVEAREFDASKRRKLDKKQQQQQQQAATGADAAAAVVVPVNALSSYFQKKVS